MKKILLSFKALILVLMMTLSTGSAWADSYKIVSTTTALKSGPISIATTTKASTIFSEGTDYVDAVAAVTAGYYGEPAGDNNRDPYIRLGKSSAAGSLTLSLSEAGQVKATSIVVNAKLYNSSKAATLNCNSVGAQDLTADLADYTFTLDGSTISTITLETSKYAYIYSITVNYEAGGATPATAPTLSDAATFFTDSYDVTITNNESGATVYYTTDGTNPTTSSESFTGDSKTISISATTTVKAMAVASGKGNSSVSSATYTKGTTYASLAELVAAGQPTTAGIPVKVTLTNVKIESIYTTSTGYRNGIYVKSGDQEIEIYCHDVPADWAVDGTISGTLTATWLLYKTTWELQPSSWDELTYTAPATAINAVETSENVSTPAYNIAGQRVNANAKGVVIRGGKKYINK